MGRTTTRGGDLLDRGSYRADRDGRVQTGAVNDSGTAAVPPRCAREIIAFARTWMPYGGPSAEEIFEQFGMSPRRFTEALWASLHDLGVGSSVRNMLETAYPRA